MTSLRKSSSFTASTLAALALALSPGRAHASSPSEADRAILAKLYADDQEQEKLGELALNNAGSKRVLSIATTLIGDHTAAAVRLVAFAARRGIAIDSPPGFTDVDDKAWRIRELKRLERLETMKGDDFDVAFLALADVRHRNALRQAEHALSRVQDAELRALITTLLPVLREHRRLTLPSPPLPST